ncbi:hypothetical protein AAFN69_29720 [Streptomyces sp. CAU 1734]
MTWLRHRLGDRRTATVRDVFVVYYVAEAALTVTAVWLVPPP